MITDTETRTLAAPTTVVIMSEDGRTYKTLHSPQPLMDEGAAVSFATGHLFWHHYAVRDGRYIDRFAGLDVYEWQVVVPSVEEAARDLRDECIPPTGPEMHTMMALVHHDALPLRREDSAYFLDGIYVPRRVIQRLREEAHDYHYEEMVDTLDAVL